MSGAPGRYRQDPTLRRSGPGGRTVLGGSPLRLFRLTDGGARVLDRALSDPAAPSQGPPPERDARPGPDAADAQVRRAAGAVPAESAETVLLDRLVDAGVLHPVPVADAAGAPTPAEVTVVVPVRDHADELRGLLESLAEVTPRPNHVVVVDDASHDRLALDGAVEAGRSRGLEVELVRRRRSGGPAAARNDGAVRAGTSVLAFLDADCTVTDRCLGPLLGHLADPRVALVAPRVRAAAGTGVLARYERSRSPLDLGDVPARVAPGTRVSYVPSAALVVRADVFAALGGFDEALRVGEDVDLVWRLVDAGHRARYEPAAVVHHAVRTGFRSWLRQRTGYGTSAAALERRHGDAVAPVVLSPWSAAVWALVVAGRPGAAVALAAATTARLRSRLSSEGDASLPAGDVARLGLLGHLGAGEQLARAVVRVWWPAAVAAAVVWRRARRVLVASGVVTATLAAVRARRASAAGDGSSDDHLAAPTLASLALVDDAAYGLGVWRGCRRERSWRALAPKLTTAVGRPDRARASGLDLRR